MKETAAALAAVWEAKHRESAEEAFAKAADGFVFESGPSFFQKAEVEMPATVLQAAKSPRK